MIVIDQSCSQNRASYHTVLYHARVVHHAYHIIMSIHQASRRSSLSSLAPDHHTVSYHHMLYHVHTIICCTPYIMYHHIMVRPSLCTVFVGLGETSGQTPYRGLVHMYHIILCCTMSIPSYAVPPISCIITLWYARHCAL